jgi:tetratricopeptide (TPR) repeat protein
MSIHSKLSSTGRHLNMKKGFSFLLLFAVLALFDASSAFQETAVELNSLGFAQYKKGNYKEALNYFRQSFAADTTYHFPHYNFACTAAILLAKDRCMHIDLLDETFAHLEKTVALKPRYRKKMEKDADLDALRRYLRFYLIAGYSPDKEKDLRKILTSLTWYGPVPGTFPPSPILEFKTDGTCRIGFFTIAGEADPGYEYVNGQFKLKGKTIEFEMEREIGDDGSRSFKAEFKDGWLIFEDKRLPPLSDDDEPCSA